MQRVLLTTKMKLIIKQMILVTIPNRVEEIDLEKHFHSRQPDMPQNQY